MLPGTIKTLIGAAGGLAVGLVIQESLLAGFDVLYGAERSLVLELRGGSRPDTGSTVLIIAIWGLATLASAAMARAVSGHLGGPLISGALWLLAIGLTTGLGPFDAWAFHAAWLAGLGGTLAGTWLASRLEQQAAPSGA